jgi:hypothetical protein
MWENSKTSKKNQNAQISSIILLLLLMTSGTSLTVSKTEETIPWFSAYLEGVLVNELEKGVRFVIERHRPMEEPATAKSHPSRLQILVPAVHKASGRRRDTGGAQLAP